MPKLSERTCRSIRTVTESRERNFDALARLAGLRPEADFRHMVLREVDFSGSNLDDFDFTGCRFQRCSFLGARIGTALLHGSEFDETDPSEALDYKDHWKRAVTNLAPDAPSPAPRLPNERKGVEAALRHLEDSWSDPDWALLFRRVWEQFRANDKLLMLARKWLQACTPEAAAPLLLTLICDPKVRKSEQQWLVKLSVDLLYKLPSDGPGWTRLWTALLDLPAQRAGLLVEGFERLRELTLQLPERRLSRRKERVWITLWAKLNEHNRGQAPWIEDQAMQAAPFLRSSDFARRVLRPMAGGSSWAVDALRQWLFREPVGRRGWARTLSEFLQEHPNADVRKLALHWLERSDPRDSGWSGVWKAVAKDRRDELAISLGLNWLQVTYVTTRGWPDVLARLLMILPRIDSQALKKQARAWLGLQWSHPHHALISAFAIGGAAHEEYASGKRPTAGLRSRVRKAAERHLDVELREVAKNRFVGSDGRIRAVIRLSKRYARANGARYWYSYYGSVNEFLDGSGSYLLLGCADRDEGYAVPADVLRTVLPTLHQTPGASPYWHIDLVQRGDRLVLSVPKEKTLVELSAYRFQLQKDDAQAHREGVT
jgi:Pentapeptide repeats (8 copies)